MLIFTSLLVPFADRAVARRVAVALLLGAVPMASLAPRPASAQEQAPMPAQAQAYKVKPLMILRFNQPNVRYERPLASAVARVRQAKPDVRFTLVAFSPAYGDAAVQEQLAGRTEGILNEVKHQLEAQGVPSDHIEAMRQRSPALTHSEIHILVR